MKTTANRWYMRLRYNHSDHGTDLAGFKLGEVKIVEVEKASKILSEHPGCFVVLADDKSEKIELEQAKELSAPQDRAILPAPKRTRKRKVKLSTRAADIKEG